MNAHPTTLELDEAAAGLAESPVDAHVRECGACRARVEALAAQAAALRAEPGFSSTRARLPAPARGRRLWWLVPAGAAALVLALLRPAALAPPEALPTLRAKGGAFLRVSPEAAALRAGDLARLRFSCGAHRFALVGALEPGAAPLVLWPPGGAHSGELAAGAHAEIAVRVTPGRARVVALFSDRPLAASDLLSPPYGAEERALELAP